MIRPQQLLVMMLPFALVAPEAFAADPMELQAPVPVGFRMPKDAVIAVVPFRDNVSDDQVDVTGSGVAAQAAWLTALRGTGFAVVEATPRDYSPTTGLDNATAVRAATAAGAAYVVNGQCTDFYRVAAGTFRTDRAGMSVEILNANGEVVFRAIDLAHAGSNLGEPEGVLSKIARRMAREL